jgi:hypothetical protein
MTTSYAITQSWEKIKIHMGIFSLPLVIRLILFLEGGIDFFFNLVKTVMLAMKLHTKFQKKFVNA